MAHTRYEKTLWDYSNASSALAGAMANAAQTARRCLPAQPDRERVIQEVAAGVAAPALVCYTLWLLGTAQESELDTLCFLARDAQVCYEIATRLAPRLGYSGRLRYVASSRRTWSLAASDPAHLDQQDWLFNSFMRSNAADVCDRLGINVDSFKSSLSQAGVSTETTSRADTPEQAKALRRFVALPEVAQAAAPRITCMRELVRDYAAQQGLNSTTTGLVDAGWTGRMIGALTTVTKGLPQPKVFFFGHEPRATGWNDPTRLTAFMYSTAAGDTMYRTPDMPFLIETFCMSADHIVADFSRDDQGNVHPISVGSTTHPAQEWGIDIYRETIYRFCESLDLPSTVIGMAALAEQMRPVLARLLDQFWITPTEDEARVWGTYPYDSDPLARATRPLALPFDAAHLREVLAGALLNRGERAWLPGSFRLSGQQGTAALSKPALYHPLGAPATD